MSSERAGEAAPVTTGWQPDRSYVPCPRCLWEPTPHPADAFSTPIHMPGTTHHGDCPTVPRLSPEDERKLRDDLAEMDRVRRRGAAEARNYVIG